MCNIFFSGVLDSAAKTREETDQKLVISNLVISRGSMSKGGVSVRGGKTGKQTGKK